VPPGGSESEMAALEIEAPGCAPLRAQQTLLAVFLGYAIFALCFQGIFYLFEYSNSDSLAPTFIKLQKDIVWTAVLSAVFYVGVIQARKVGTLLRPYSLILLAFCIWVVAVKAAELSTYGTYSIALLTLKNLILYAAMIPLLSMLSEEAQNNLARKMLVVLVVVALAQSAFSATLFILFPEYAFWRDDPYNGFTPFVGLFSNPNRFGLFLNMGAAVLCTVLIASTSWRTIVAAAGLLALALSIFYAAALSQLIVYFFLLGYAAMIAAVKVGWRCLRLPAVMVTAAIAIGWVGLNFKSPLSDETHTGGLVWDVRNLAALAVDGKTLNGEPFRFTSDSFINRGKELSDLLESFGFRWAWHGSGALIRQQSSEAPLEQRLFGRPHHMAPASQSQFAYFYFRYGLVGLLVFFGVLAIPAVRSFLMLMRRSDDPHQMLLSYHLCLVAFIVTFVPDNGLLDFPTNFLLFFVLFAIQSLTAPLKRPPVT
jgi:hypothetical protein